MRKFTKQANDFNTGMQELAKVSFSAEQSLCWSTADGKLPESEKEAVLALAENAIEDRTTGNGVDWNVVCNITPFGVDYETKSGLKFGWKALVGASDQDSFEGKYIFYIAHPRANEESAAPLESSLRQSASEYGWVEQSTFIYQLS